MVLSVISLEQKSLIVTPELGFVPNSRYSGFLEAINQSFRINRSIDRSIKQSATIRYANHINIIMNNLLNGFIFGALKSVCLYSFYIDKLLLNVSKCLKIYEIYSVNMSQVSLLMNCL